MSLRMSGLKGQLLKKEQSEHGESQNAIIWGSGVFLEGHSIENSVSNITRRLKGVGDLRVQRI